MSEELGKIRRSEIEKGRHWLNPAAIACALTHRDKLLTAAQLHQTILCEDDIVLDSKFICEWQKIEARDLFKNLNEPVLLHYFSRSPIIAREPVIAKFGKYSIYKLESKHISSAACYYIQEKIASKIIDFQTPIETSADNWQEIRKSDCFSDSYIIHPAATSIAGFSSTIGYGDNIKSNHIFSIFARKIKRHLMRSRKKYLRI